MTISKDGASQLLIVPPAKCFTGSISQSYLEEPLLQILLDAYDYSNDASQDENRNPHFRYQDAQILPVGIQMVVPCPDIPEAPASPCNVPDYLQWGDTVHMSMPEILFGTPDIQKASESGDATDARDDAQDVPMDEDSVSDKDGDRYAAAEPEDELELVLETIPQSPMKSWTRSKSRKVIIVLQ